MVLYAIFFYLFATVAVLSAVMVISSRNPVHSVLFLILVFINAAGLFLMLGAEFLALIVLVVYVGAVAVLFLFVVMMLDVDFTELRQGLLQYLPIGGLVGVILLVELVIGVSAWVIDSNISSAPVAPIPTDGNVSNIEAIGELLYTRYFYFFQAAGMILLVAMIGAIVLTLRHKAGVKRQDISRQVARTPETSIKIHNDVESGKGLTTSH